MTSNIAKSMVFAGLIAVLGLAFLAQAEPVFAQYATVDVRVNFINDNDINCHKAADRATQPYMQSGRINWNAQVVNNGPGGAYLMKAAFHDPVSGCAPTSLTVVQSAVTMSGKTTYGQGETGNAFFSYDLNAFSCGRVQVDAGYAASDGSGGNTVFLGEVIDYGTDCPANRAPMGVVEKIDCNTVTGWGGDPDSFNYNAFFGVTVNGPYGTGEVIAHRQTDVYRADVNAAFNITGNHGFNVAFPAKFKDGRTHGVWVYVMDTTTNAPALVGQGTVDTAGCSGQPVIKTGTINVTSNIPTAWTVSGPQTFSGTGLSAGYTAQVGSYTLANVPANLIYNSQRYQLSGTGNPNQTLVENAAITFTITYVPVTDVSSPRISGTSNSDCGYIRLTWQDNSNNESGFKVYRSDSDHNGDYTKYSHIATLAADSTQYLDRPALNRSFYYIVAAYSNQLGITAASQPVRSSFNTPCVSNLTGSADIVAVNGAAIGPAGIKHNDTVTLQITIDNGGPSEAYVTHLIDNLGTGLRNPRNLTVTGLNAVVGSPAITGTEPDVRLNVSGRKEAGGNRWIIKFDATVNMPIADASIQNCATVHYFDDAGNKTAKFCTPRILGASTNKGGVNFREVAP